MSVLKFTWNGVSSDDYGIEVMRLPGGFIAAERVTDVVVPGRSGTLHITEEAMDEQILQIDCYLPYSQRYNTAASIPKIARWLRGSGVLTMSNSSALGYGTFKYKGRIINGIGMNHIVTGFDDVLFSITIAVEPYRYTDVYPTEFDLPGGGTVVPTGAQENLYAPWEPTYVLQTRNTSLTGTGTLEVKWGANQGVTMIGHDLPGRKAVVIDTKNKIITIDGALATEKFEGEWPLIPADTFDQHRYVMVTFPGTDNFFQSIGSKVILNKRCY